MRFRQEDPKQPEEEKTADNPVPTNSVPKPPILTQEEYYRQYDGGKTLTQDAALSNITKSVLKATVKKSGNYIFIRNY